MNLKLVYERMADLVAKHGNTEFGMELVFYVVRKALEEDAKVEAERAAARERQRRRRQRDTGRDSERDVDRDNERDISVTGDVTVSPLDPPSGDISLSDSGSPDPSEPDQEDPHFDERLGPVTRYSSSFLLFWANYPKKVGKDTAWKAWKRKKPDVQEVLRAIAWQRQSKKWRDGFIPNPATYLNGACWLDERDTSRDIGVTPAVTVPSLRDVFCVWHTQALNSGRPASTPKPGCPECDQLGKRGTAQLALGGR